MTTYGIGRGLVSQYLDKVDIQPNFQIIAYQMMKSTINM